MGGYIHLHHDNRIGCYAKVAQLVERDLAKVEVAGSNPVFRSETKHRRRCFFLLQAFRILARRRPGWWNR